jgi:hypothetical protein
MLKLIAAVLIIGLVFSGAHQLAVGLAALAVFYVLLG